MTLYMAVTADKYELPLAVENSYQTLADKFGVKHKTMLMLLSPSHKARQARNWTEEEKQYLTDNWGTLSIGTLMSKLNRTKNSINIMVQRLGLGPFLDSGDYITWNQLQTALGCGSGGYKMLSWVRNRKFPLHTKRVGENSFKIVYIDEFWKWAEKNKDLLNFSKFEENVLGKEPGWVKEKRIYDYDVARRYKTSPWTGQEDDQLAYLVKQYKSTYYELSNRLRRTCGAIQTRLCFLGIKERPIKADNHIKWTEEEIQLIVKSINNGYGYEYISDLLGKSSKAVRGKIGRMYCTENLDKVRAIIIEQ